MKKLSLIALFFYSIFISCNQENKETKDFKKQFYITGKEIVFDNDLQIFNIYIVDTFLLVKTNDKNFFFSLYDAKTLKLIMRIAKKGMGPMEFHPRSGLKYCNTIFDNNHIKIWVFGIIHNKLFLIDINKSIENNKTIVTKEYQLRKESQFFDVFFVDSTKVIGRSANTTPNMNRMQIYNPVSDTIIKTVEIFPEVKNNNNDLDFLFYRYNSLYISVLRMKPDKSMFPSSMRLFNRLDIFDNNGILKYSYIDKENITKSQINQFLEAKDNEIEKLNLMYYYTGEFVSDSYIYTLYRNQLKREYAEKAMPTTIRIFNWKAEPVCEIKVPDYLTSFTVDEKNGIMYGVAYFDEKILKYDIKSILDEIKK